MTAMTRSEFLAGAAALAALRPWNVFGALAPSARDANLCIGVISDIHVRARTGQFGTEHLIKALTWFRDRGVDGVVIAGDLADDGLVSQLHHVADAWNAVFPKGSGVEKLFVYGNHDIEGLSYNSKLKPAPEDIIATDRAAAWEKAFGEPYEPIWRKTIKGYAFIGAHWVSWKGVPEIERYMAEHADELRGDKPFFYIPPWRFRGIRTIRLWTSVVYGRVRSRPSARRLCDMLSRCLDGKTQARPPTPTSSRCRRSTCSAKSRGC